MRKFSRLMIYNYVNGLDLENVSVEELENCPEFMAEVLKFTHDKRCYSLCSNEVKSDFDFVKKTILSFKDDQDFICHVANKYFKLNKSNVNDLILPILLNTNDDDLEKEDFKEYYDELHLTELLIILCNLTSPTGKYHKEYKKKLDRIISKNLFIIGITKEGICLVDDSDDNVDECEIEEEIIESFGIGFGLIYDTFYESETVTDYYAQKFVEIIFAENGSLESSIHSRFSKYSDLEKMGLNNYVISLINSYDEELATYIKLNVHLLDDIMPTKDKIQQNWDNFEINKKTKRYERIEDEVDSYIRTNCPQHEYELLEIIYYTLNQMDIMGEIIMPTYLDYDYKENAKSIDKSTWGLQEMIHYNEIKKIIFSIIKADEGKPSYVQEDESNEASENDCHPTIIQFVKK